MKKYFAVGATAALILAASSPAFAQGLNDDNFIVNDSGNTNVQFVDASQFQVSLQAQFGDATAVDDSVAIVASDQGITQNQFNGGVDDGFDDGFFFVD